MNVNDFYELQQSLTPAASAAEPQRDRSEQVNVGLEMARRQAEKTPPEQTAIPSAGATAVPN